MTKQKIYDVAIIGGGLSGLTMACLLGQSGFSVLCLDRESKVQTLQADFDGRTTAISYGSRAVLQEAGVWDLCSALTAPILDIQILDGSSSVLLNFLSRDVDDKEFGFIIENRLLRAAQYQCLDNLKTVDHFDSIIVNDIQLQDHYADIQTDKAAFKARLIIGADGKQSFVREWLNVPYHELSYAQSAIVCCVEHTNPHQNVAIEHFRDEGPFAVLPMNDDPVTGAHRSSLVWTVHGTDRRMIECDLDIFNTALQTRFPKFYGDVKAITPRSVWPLSLKHAHAYVGTRAVIIAEAAHAMHPIAGQGLNVGMRDIKILHDMLCKARDKKQDISDAALLKNYQEKRHFDTMAMMAATDILNRLFSNSFPMLGLARKIGIRMVDRFPPAKQFFMRQAMGLGFDAKRHSS